MFRPSMTSVPSFAQGFARSQADAANPGLRDGLLVGWQQTLGQTGNTLYDVSGHGRDGIVSDVPLSLPGWVNTELGPASDFTTNERFAVHNTSWFPLSGPMSVWLLLRIDAAGGEDIYLSCGYANGYGGFDVEFNRISGQEYFMWNDSATQVALDLSDGVWYSLFGTRTPTTGTEGTIEAWVNGVSKGTATTNDISYSTQDLLIGGPHDSGRGFDGQIAAMAVWDRALPYSQIATLNPDADPHAIVRPMQRTLAGTTGAPAAGAVMNQMQGANLGADLFDGVLIA